MSQYGSEGIIWACKECCSMDISDASGKTKRFTLTVNGADGPGDPGPSTSTTTDLAATTTGWQQSKGNGRNHYQSFSVCCLDYNEVSNYYSVPRHDGAAGQTEKFRNTKLPGGQLRGTSFGLMARLVKVGHAWFYKDGKYGERPHNRPVWQWELNDLLEYTKAWNEIMTKNSFRSLYGWTPYQHTAAITNYVTINGNVTGSSVNIGNSIVNNTFIASPS